MARRGEAVFSLILLVTGSALLVEAYGIDGIGKWDSAGSIPLIAASIMVLMAGYVLIRSLLGQDQSSPPVTDANEPPDADAPASSLTGKEHRLPAGLIPYDLVGVLALLLGYIIAIGYTGFYPATLVFVAATIAFLQRGRPVQAAIIGLVCVVAIYGAFETFFQVRLP